MVDHSAGDAPPPAAVAYVRDLLDGFGAAWFLCGGWAADAWLGRQTRDHDDVDVAVFHHDHAAIVEHLAGWALVAHDPNVADDTTEQWHGRQLDRPAHVHVPALAGPLATSKTLAHADFEFEFILVDGTDSDWILNADHGIRVPREHGIRLSPWGVPAAAPEIVLFVKAGGNLPATEAEAGTAIRPRDEQDFFALLPVLSAAERLWLRKSLGAVHPGHPGSSTLGSDIRAVGPEVPCHERAGGSVVCAGWLVVRRSSATSRRPVVG
jgi:hypothetical protein